MTRYQALAIAAAVGTYLLIVAGAVVRVTGSGLGCPDWPTCHGQLVPPLDVAAIVEYTHRLLGALVSPLILAATAGAWWLRRGERQVLVPATLAPALLVVQIVLGAIVVRLELATMVVLVHLAFAMLILGLLVWTAVAAGPVPHPRGTPGARGRLPGLATLTAAAILLLVLVGAYVRATGAGWACAGFPDCNGQALPFGTDRLVDIHLLHRLLAYAVAALVAAVVWEAWRDWRWLPAVPRAATTLAILVAAQIAIGAVGVSTELPALVRALHVAGAAAVWAAAVVLVCLVARAHAEMPVPASAAAVGARSGGGARSVPSQPVPSA